MILLNIQFYILFRIIFVDLKLYLAYEFQNILVKFKDIILNNNKNNIILYFNFSLFVFKIKIITKKIFISY